MVAKKVGNEELEILIWIGKVGRYIAPSSPACPLSIAIEFGGELI
jgi:hypothetical protein